MSKPKIISDHQRLVGAKNIFGRDVRVHDDGYGPLWIHRDSMGVSGIVRSRTFEAAYEICEDEFFPDCDLTHEEIVKEYGFKRERVKIVRDSSAQAGEHTSAGERIVRDSDYVDGKLPEHLFVRWLTVETPDPEAWEDNELFQEAYGFRPSGGGTGENNKNPIYSKDINGDSLEEVSLEEVTQELLDILEIKLLVEDEEAPEPPLNIVKHLKDAADDTFAARWALVAHKATGGSIPDDLEARLKDIETNIREIRATIS